MIKLIVNAHPLPKHINLTIIPQPQMKIQNVNAFETIGH